MKRLKLGRTDIEVSELCLGSMTWGTQNTEAEGHAQIDMALDRGCDFIDTAEMYPVNPVRAETVGITETIIGSWFAKTGRRDEVVLATKMSGLNGGFVRKNIPPNPDTLREALDGSLKRLQTDYIDLYQLHWPNRGSFQFRQNWAYDPRGQNPEAEIANMVAMMEVLRELVAEGKIRAFGLSNESSWGAMQWLKAAEATGGPRVASIQNEYSLLDRLYDTDMSETSVNEEITLLAFSPLATGLLTGKYQGGVIPDGSRMSLSETLGGRRTERAFVAVDAYLDIAKRHGLDPSQMAIAWCRTRPFQTVPIFGATSLEQLDVALGAAEVTLSDAVLDEIDKAHRAHPMPY